MLWEAFHQVSSQEDIWFGNDDGWRIPRWLFRARQSLVCKWDDFSYF